MEGNQRFVADLGQKSKEFVSISELSLCGEIFWVKCREALIIKFLD